MCPALWKRLELGSLTKNAMSDEMQEVVFERVFKAISASEDVKLVKLRIGPPFSVPDSSGTTIWRCPFQIVGLGLEKVKFSIGEDAIDALLNSLKLSEIVLNSYRSIYEIRITWLDNDWLGLSTSRLPISEKDAQNTINENELAFKKLFDEFFDSKESEE